MRMNTLLHHHRPKILISKCLLPDQLPVAWHGKKPKISLYSSSSTSRKNFLRQQLLLSTSTTSESLFSGFELIPFCPEMDGLKLPVPRPPIRIVVNDGNDNEDRKRRDRKYVLSSKKAEQDNNFSPALSWSDEDLDDIFSKIFAENDGLDWVHSISGFIAKSKSPMCGHFDTKEFIAVDHNNNNDEKEFDVFQDKVHGGFVRWLMMKKKCGEKTNNNKIVIATEKELDSMEKLKEFLDRVKGCV